MAFVSECKMVANFWLRSGDPYTSNNIEAFLDDTFEKLQGKKVGLFRADSGFYDKKVFDHLEKRSINYIVAVRLYAPVQQLIASHKTWFTLSDGIEIAESTYQSPLWKTPRRTVMLRQHIPTRPKATGLSLKLFQEEGFINSIATAASLLVWICPLNRSGRFTANVLMQKTGSRNLNTILAHPCVPKSENHSIKEFFFKQNFYF
jgi:hypothetical protein